MGIKERMHERMISFFPFGGHNHDGVNSTPVELTPESVEFGHLDRGLIDWIKESAGGGGGTDQDDGGVVPVPDLKIETTSVGPGGTLTGEADWTTLCAVRLVRLVMDEDTEATITFYHKATFADEDREFRATNCSNKFMWEGPWIHYDEDNYKKLYYKIQNTGNQPARFQLTLKSGTMAANVYANMIDSIVAGNNQLTGPLKFIEGNGMSITSDDASGNITFSAVAPETVVVNNWALTPVKPVAFTSSTAFTNLAYLLDGYTHDTNRYSSFGSGLQWIQADLGAVYNLGAVKVVQYFGDGRVYNDTKVEISGDGSSWITIKSVGPHWSTGEGLHIEMPKGLMARYIRFTCNGSSANTENHLIKIIPYLISNKG